MDLGVSDVGCLSMFRVRVHTATPVLNRLFLCRLRALEYSSTLVIALRRGLKVAKIQDS